eukprot:m.168598 g.168598  ORF g.168598 m.168598 type:complete len:58 (-) comp16652_c0_seq6:56-229(-)
MSRRWFTRSSSQATTSESKQEAAPRSTTVTARLEAQGLGATRKEQLKVLCNSFEYCN